MVWEAHHRWEAGLCVHGQVLEQQYWIRPSMGSGPGCCHWLRGCSGAGWVWASSSFRPPCWVSMGGLSCLGATGWPHCCDAMASLAAWAGEAPALLARLVPVRCIPADIPGQGEVPQEATSRVPAGLIKSLWGKKCFGLFSRFKLKTS